MADQTTPEIQTPKDGAAVDGMAATLSWDPVRNADHRVQVSANDRFDAVIVEADAGPSDSLTLYGLLPSDGRRLHWRVGASRGGDALRWSDPAWFLAADMDDRPASKAATPARSGKPRAHEPARAASPDEEPLYLRGTTGSGEVTVALVVLLVTMVVILIAAF